MTALDLVEKFRAGEITVEELRSGLNSISTAPPTPYISTPAPARPPPRPPTPTQPSVLDDSLAPPDLVPACSPVYDVIAAPRRLSVAERLYSKARDAEARNDALRSANAQRELAECKFVPELISAASSGVRTSSRVRAPPPPPAPAPADPECTFHPTITPYQPADPEAAQKYRERRAKAQAEAQRQSQSQRPTTNSVAPTMTAASLYCAQPVYDRLYKAAVNPAPAALPPPSPPRSPPHEARANWREFWERQERATTSRQLAAAAAPEVGSFRPVISARSAALAEAGRAAAEQKMLEALEAPPPGPEFPFQPQINPVTERIVRESHRPSALALVGLTRAERLATAGRRLPASAEELELAEAQRAQEAAVSRRARSRARGHISAAEPVAAYAERVRAQELRRVSRVQAARQQAWQREGEQCTFQPRNACGGQLGLVSEYVSRVNHAIAAQDAADAEYAHREWARSAHTSFR